MCEFYSNPLTPIWYFVKTFASGIKYMKIHLHQCQYLSHGNAMTCDGNVLTLLTLSVIGGLLSQMARDELEFDFICHEPKQTVEQKSMGHLL